MIYIKVFFLYYMVVGLFIAVVEPDKRFSFYIGAGFVASIALPFWVIRSLFRFVMRMCGWAKRWLPVFLRGEK